jgi:hypothetical protein
MTLTEKTLTPAALAVAIAVALLAPACGPAKPATPSFAKDVAPIFDAHCTRCHSSHGPDGGFLDNPVTGKTPVVCHLDFYEGSPATCAADGGVPPPACQGAHYCATMYKQFMSSYINGVSDPMPPPPSSLMNDWERDVVERWISNPIP